MSHCCAVVGQILSCLHDHSYGSASKSSDAIICNGHRKDRWVWNKSVTSHLTSLSFQVHFFLKTKKPDRRNWLSNMPSTESIRIVLSFQTPLLFTTFSMFQKAIPFMQEREVSVTTANVEFFSFVSPLLPLFLPFLCERNCATISPAAAGHNLKKNDIRNARISANIS